MTCLNVKQIPLFFMEYLIGINETILIMRSGFRTGFLLSVKQYFVPTDSKHMHWLR